MSQFRKGDDEHYSSRSQARTAGPRQARRGAKGSPLALAGGLGRSPEVMKPSPLALAGGLGRSPEVMKPSPLALAGGLGAQPQVQMTTMTTTNSFDTARMLSTGGGPVRYYSLPALEAAGYPGVARLPYSLKILLENMLRREDGRFVTARDIETLARWTPGTHTEIAFMPARVLLQDFTGVPAIVDLAAMRDGIARLGGDPEAVNPAQPAELVIDHSVQVDYFARPDAFDLNAKLEFSRNRERYAFLKWGQEAFRNFRVVPPGTGIVHQVNIEYLARVVCRDGANGDATAYPDTLVGTDSHTTMVNGLGVVGWGVGGIEAEAAMLGQPISMLIPDVIGFRLVGALPDGTTATDLVLTITEQLRQYGVVGKFVEFCGPGLASLTVADRATLGNMSPEYGSTVAICPIDDMTLDYLRLTGRDGAQVELVEAYARAQGLFAAAAEEPLYTDAIELDLATVEPSLAGPKRPQDRVPLRSAKAAFAGVLDELAAGRNAPAGGSGNGSAAAGVEDGAVVIAAITSCTNTSNPSVMIAAGLVAQRAQALGLRPKPWVKTSLAPGSLVVTEYLRAAGLLEPLEQLGFGLVGYGCTTCIGNSGPLPDEVAAAVRDNDLVVTSVLSGNRNFEGRVQPLVRANYLASPPLVVAYALAGRMTVDLTREPLGRDANGADVYLKDIWPSAAEVQRAMAAALHTEQFTAKYAGVFDGDERWRGLFAPVGDRFDWTDDSTYVRHPPFFQSIEPEPSPPGDIAGARVLALLGDSVTTDHISPAGAIPPEGPAGRYLIAQGVAPQGLQLVRQPPRQPRGDDARHLRQHPPAEPAGARYGGRLDAAPARRRADVHLRRRHGVPGGRDSAAGAGRQGIRVRVVTRLGRQGHAATGRQGGHRRELRAHPPQQPRVHGRAAAGVPHR